MNKTKSLAIKQKATKVVSIHAPAKGAEIWATGGYTRRLIPDEGGGYTATVQEFPGCIAEGDTADEALSHLGVAASAWIESQLELGQEVPRPLDYAGFSGRIALRIPRGLHRRAAEVAAEEGVSLNQFLTSAISYIVGQKNVLNEVRREVAKVRPSYIFLSAQMKAAETHSKGAPTFSLGNAKSFVTPPHFLSFEKLSTD